MLKNFLLLVVSTLLVLGLLELVLRGLGPKDEVTYVLDDELIIRPGASRRLRYVRFPENGGEVIETRFDEHGFRIGGGDPLDRKAYRIFVYGDSFIQASFSRVEETFTAQLARRLAGDVDVPLHVVNAGVDSYGPDQVYLRVRREVPIFGPDLVVVSVFADNDAGDLVRNKLFRLGEDGSLERHAFVLSEELVHHYEQRRRLNDRTAIGKVLADPKLLRRDLRILFERRLGLNADWLADTPIDTAYRTGPDVDWIELWQRRGLEEYADYVTEGRPQLNLDNLRQDHYDADIAIAPAGPSATYKLALLGAVLAELTSYLRQRQIPLVLMIVPSPIDACTPYDWTVDETRYPDYDRRLLTRSVAQTANRLAVRHVDLFDSFATNECNELYFHHGNNHWNARGQALAAELVAEQIRSSALLKQKSTH